MPVSFFIGLLQPEAHVTEMEQVQGLETSLEGQDSFEQHYLAGMAYAV